MKKLITVLGLVGLTACASSQVQKQVDEEATRQPSRPFHGEVAMKGFESIEASKDLTSDQKRQLRELESKVAVETFKNQDEMAKLKGVLFETITKMPYQRDKVEVIKGKLTALNNKKMATMFKALDDFEKIIGEAPQREVYFRDFFKGHNY